MGKHPVTTSVTYKCDTVVTTYETLMTLGAAAPHFQLSKAHLRLSAVYNTKQGSSL